MARTTLATIVLAAAVSLLAPAAALACSCVPLSPERVQEADAAVVAQLKRVRADDGAVRGVFVYRVRRALVGSRLDRGDRLRVRSHLDSAACGLSQEPRRYGLVLGRENRRWSASLCSETTPEALRALVRGERAGKRYC
jgi:hypothetical protein